MWHALTSITATAGAVTQQATSVQTAAAAKHAFKFDFRTSECVAIAAAKRLAERQSRVWNSMPPEQPLPPSLRADTAIAEPQQLSEQSISSLTVCISSVVSLLKPESIGCERSHVTRAGWSSPAWASAQPSQQQSAQLSPDPPVLEHHHRRSPCLRQRRVR